ncbi:MAG: class I SAM-dependent DNA methyltransferase, partial [Candidatus Brocadiae bacterium]|nr:class I SAM-dependent DNA methyltransferase [Candidatus Brocadiia bacterium]
SDRPWVLDGASVHVSMVAFDDGAEDAAMLDGVSVSQINSNLTAGVDLTAALKLRANASLGFQGTIKRGPFDVTDAQGLTFLKGGGGNPHGRPNSDVVVPYLNGKDVTARCASKWIVVFPNDKLQEDAARYEAPFAHAKTELYPARQEARQRKAREEWWVLWCPRPQMFAALLPHERFIVTPRVAKHRLFSWARPPVHPDCQLIVFARSDDYFFGVLHSRVHEVWARAQGTQLRERESGFRYTPTTCFATFPFPWPPGREPQDDARQDAALVKAIAEPARELNELRENWLNPPEWTTEEVLEFPGSVDGPWARYVHDPDHRGIGTVRYPRLVDNGVMPSQLKKRTLTNLYNEMPAWLRNAHAKLDDAVFAAYAASTDDPAWNGDIGDEEMLEKLLELNLARSAAAEA